MADAASKRVHLVFAVRPDRPIRMKPGRAGAQSSIRLAEHIQVFGPTPE
jgi:hypothetical protein